MEAEGTVALSEPQVGPRRQPGSLEEVYRREYEPMLRLAHLVTGSDEAAEDLVQEAFVRLWRHWDEADRPGAYLRTVVVNLCRGWQRRQILERRPRPGAPAAVVDDGARELLDALGRLGARQRTALVLRFYADMSEAEVARALGCRPGTVKSLVHRGLRQLEEVIER